MPKVVFFVSAGGTDITSKISGRLVEMVITDGVGSKSDSAQIVLDDKDGSVAAPRTGVVLNLKGGYEGNIRDFGDFVVDNVSYEGWPQKITIKAQSVDAKGPGKEKEPKGYPSQKFPKYGDIFSTVAGKVGLSLKMSASLKSLVNNFEAQGEESPLEFATRIADKIGASVTVKSGRMIVVESGSGKSAGGKDLVPFAVAPGLNLLSYQVSNGDQPKHSEVEATYYDRKKNKREAVKEPTKLEGPKFLIKTPFATKGEAETAAKAKAKDLVRAQASANFTIDGTPEARAEAYANVSGCRQNVDGLWRVQTVVHNFSGSGAYTTDLECEVPSP